MPENRKTGFFPKNRAPSLLTLYGPLTSCKRSEKVNEPILRKLGDRLTDWQTDGRDWIHRTTGGPKSIQSIFCGVLVYQYPDFKLISMFFLMHDMIQDWGEAPCIFQKPEKFSGWNIDVYQVRSCMHLSVVTSLPIAGKWREDDSVRCTGPAIASLKCI